MTAHGRQLSRRERVVPWVALLLPPLSWITYEYGAVIGLRASCAAIGTWLGPIWGFAGLIGCALAAALAWPLARKATEQPPVRLWLARVATFGAGVFAVAIGFQTLATLIIPACTR